MAGEKTIKVRMLGCFSISCGEGETARVISDENHASRKCCALLQYLIVHRDRPLPKQELAEALWPDGDLGSALNTLKTLVHRTRRLLDTLGALPGAQLVTYANGAYSWNNAADTWVDLEVFGKMLEDARAVQDEQAALDMRLEALTIYGGDFLPRRGGELWPLPLVSYYHQRFVDGCRQVIAPLMSRNRYAELAQLLRRAILVEPYDEELNTALIRALLLSGEREAAMALYNSYTDMLMSQLGVAPPDSLTDLYRELVRTSHHTETDLGVVRERMSEGDGSEGAFYCEYEIFREVFRLTARRTARTGQAVQLAMITVGPGPLKSSISVRRLRSNMQRLGEVIFSTLRTGDAYTQYSGNQYLIMLPSASYEDGELVMERLTRRFHRAHPKADVELQTSLRPLLPKL